MSRTSTRKTTASLILFLCVVASLAATRPSMPQGKVSVHDISLVTITGEDIRNLPIGESRIIQKWGGGNNTAMTKTGPGKLVINYGGSDGTTDLTKVGTGTLILPNISGAGVTKHGPGTLEHAPPNSTGGTKELSGTLILANSPDVVYEFKNVSAAEFDRIFMPTEESAGVAARILGLRRYVAQHRPARAMSGWPFARLVIGRREGIAKAQGWKPGTIASSTKGTKYDCYDGFCHCQSGDDCFNLANTGSCVSQITCDGPAGTGNCYCTSK